VAVLELPLDLFETGEVSPGGVAEIAGIGHLQLNDDYKFSGRCDGVFSIAAIV